MKKVCHLTSVHSRYDIRIFLKECTSLAKAGYEVILVVADGKSDEYVNGIKIIDVGLSHSRFDRMFYKTKKVYKKAMEVDADLYHFHDFELIKTGKKLIKKGKKVIYDIHENFPKAIIDREWVPKIFRWISGFLVEKYENISVKKFTYLITARRDIKTRFKKQKRKVMTINNYSILDDLYSEKKSKSLKKDKVSYVGGISRLRGILEMIKSTEDTPVKLNLAGKFDEGPLKNKAKALKGWQNVNELGLVKRDTVKEILNNSFAGLVVFHPAANHTTTQPNKLYEYMSASLAVICSDFALWKSIVDQYKIGIYVNPLNSDEIKKAIMYLYQNQEKAQEMGQNGRRTVEKYFNWPREEKKLLTIYNLILS